MLSFCSLPSACALKQRPCNCIHKGAISEGFTWMMRDEGALLTPRFARNMQKVRRIGEANARSGSARIVSADSLMNVLPEDYEVLRTGRSRWTAKVHMHPAAEGGNRISANFFRLVGLEEQMLEYGLLSLRADPLENLCELGDIAGRLWKGYAESASTDSLPGLKMDSHARVGFVKWVVTNGDDTPKKCYFMDVELTEKKTEA
jgi:hypothetical protein